MKRILSTCLAMVLCLGLTAPVQAVDYGVDIPPEDTYYTQKFSDVPTTHWAFQFVSELSDRGAISGFPDGRFYPDQTVTRAEFSTIMTKAAGLNPQPVSSTGFVDVPANNWAAPYVAAAKPYMTYYQSNGQASFKPSQATLREDVAIAVVKMKGYDISLANLSTLQTMFTDYSSISEEARPYVAIALDRGLISGYPDRTFRGQKTVSRAEASVILWRAFQYGNDDKVIGDNTTTTDPSQGSQTNNNTQTNNNNNQNNQTSGTQQTMPNAVNTLVTLPSGMNSCVVTKDKDVYYIKDNGLYRVSNGTINKLKDGGDEEFKMLSYDLESNQAYLLTTYLALRKSYNDYYSGRIYNVSNSDVVGFQEEESHYEIFMDYVHGFILSGNNTLLFENNNYDVYKVDMNNGTARRYGQEGKQLFTNSQKMYAFFQNNKLMQVYDGELTRYNLATGNWDPIMIQGNNLSKATAFTVQDGTIYYCTDTGLFQLEALEGSQMKTVNLLKWEDLDIQDDMPMGKVESFFFDEDGSIVFFDATSSLVRTISK